MSDPTFDVRWGVATDTGVLRSDNQDAHLAEPPVFVVADGMGGHRAGREAADLVVRSFAEVCLDPWTSPQELAEAITTADQAVRALAQEVAGAPGSTVSGAATASHDGVPSWLIFNVGDSRTYLLRGETLELVTVDHSQRQALREQGFSDAEAAARSSSNVITRAIGGGLRGTPQADLWLLPALTGDRILICSDGLTGELSDPLIAAHLMAHDSPEEAASELVAAAVRSGGRDNITAVVIDATTVSGAPALGGLGDLHDTTDGIDLLIDDTRPDLPAYQA